MKQPLPRIAMLGCLPPQRGIMGRQGPIPFAARTQLSILLDMPVTSLMRPQSIAALQAPPPAPATQPKTSPAPQFHDALQSEMGRLENQ